MCPGVSLCFADRLSSLLCKRQRANGPDSANLDTMSAGPSRDDVRKLQKRFRKTMRNETKEEHCQERAIQKLNEDMQSLKMARSCAANSDVELV